MANAALDSARLAIADKIDEWTLETALSRLRRGEDIRSEIDTLVANSARRRVFFGQPKETMSAD